MVTYTHCALARMRRSYPLALTMPTSAQSLLYFITPLWMRWESERKAEPRPRSGAVLPDKSSQEEQGTTRRTSKWKGRLANLLLGIPDNKNVIPPSDFPYARDLKRAEGKERGKGKSHRPLWAKARNIQPSGAKREERVWLVVNMPPGQGTPSVKC